MEHANILTRKNKQKPVILQYSFFIMTALLLVLAIFFLQRYLDQKRFDQELQHKGFTAIDPDFLKGKTVYINPTTQKILIGSMDSPLQTIYSLVENRRRNK